MGDLSTGVGDRMSRLNVALVSPYDLAYPGGVSVQVAELDRALRDLGHQTTIIAPFSGRYGRARPTNLVVAGRVISVPTNGAVARITLSLQVSGLVKRLLREGRFDVIHLHEPFMPLLPYFVLHHSTTANVATFHAYSRNQLGYRHGRFLLRPFFARLHGRIAVSATARSFIAQHFPSRYEIIPNGVDLERFQGATPRPELADGTPTILFVGRLDERKGFPTLLRAFARLRRQGIVARLVIVGAASDRQRGQYEQLIAAAEIPDIVFTGYVPMSELPRFYQAADLVCAPSRGGESFGMVLIEAMAAGKPIVATRIAGYQELVEHGREGLLVEPNDSEELAAALRLLLGDPGWRDEMGQAGRAKVREFAWPIVVQRILQEYDRAIGEFQHGAPRLIGERR